MQKDLGGGEDMNTKKPKQKKGRSPAKARMTIKEKIPLIAIKAGLALFATAIVGLVIFTYHLLYRSDSFIIKGSKIEWQSKPYTDKTYDEFLEIGKGENILSFDAKTATDGILIDNPEFKDIQIIKTFPDRLTFRVAGRVPVAQVGEWSFYLIDDEGVTLTKIRDSIEEDFPIITGAEWRILHKVGYKDESLRMKKGLVLLESITESGFLNDHTLTKIDISDYRNIAFFIEDGLEIKIGSSNFRERLDQLTKTLASIVVDKDEIKYIDLRFDDVVLGTK
jgi:cell division septal protein FtsQ